MRWYEIGSADTSIQRSSLGRQVDFSVWIRSSGYLYFGRLRLPVVVAFDTAMTIEETYSQLVMPGSYPPPNRDDGRGSSWGYINPSQSSQATTQYVGGSSAADYASSQHGTSSARPYHDGSSLEYNFTALRADPPLPVLEPRVPVSNMTLPDPFRPATSHVSDRSQHLLSTPQSNLPGTDNRSAATAYSSNSVPVVTPTDHRDQSAQTSHNQVGLWDSISDEQAMVSNEVQIVEISYLSLPVLRQYLYAMKDPSKLPGPDE
jgi:hypothetical protein